MGGHCQRKKLPLIMSGGSSLLMGFGSAQEIILCQWGYGSVLLKIVLLPVDSSLFNICIPYFSADSSLPKGFVTAYGIRRFSISADLSLVGCLLLLRGSVTGRGLIVIVSVARGFVTADILGIFLLCSKGQSLFDSAQLNCA